LSAAYVFVVGFVNGSIPEDPGEVTNDEVCSLIVALSRARKECQLVTCRNFAGSWYEPSMFLGWLHQPVDERLVDKSYWGNA
jgi:ATP-dependent DNA helicase UvrD/PcrA